MALTEVAWGLIVPVHHNEMKNCACLAFSKKEVRRCREYRLGLEKQYALFILFLCRYQGLTGLSSSMAPLY